MWVSHLCFGSGRYVGFVPGGVGAQRARFVWHINVIKNSDFVVYSKFGMDHFGLWRLNNVDCEL